MLCKMTIQTVRAAPTQVSLSVAQRNFVDFGASERQFLPKVRPPAIHEMPTISILALEANQIVRNREKAMTQILAVIRGVLSTQIGVIDGALFLSSMSHYLNLDPEWSDELRIFRGIASEIDDLPTGMARQFWAPQALAQKDQELASYESRIRETVVQQCQSLEGKLRSHLLGLSR
jgi:Protein of unknown function (DUF2489)/Cysteine-rich CPCC